MTLNIKVSLAAAFKEADGTLSFMGLTCTSEVPAGFKGDAAILGRNDKVVGLLFKRREGANPKAPPFSGYLGDARLALWQAKHEKVAYWVQVSPGKRQTEYEGGGGERAPADVAEHSEATFGYDDTPF